MNIIEIIENREGFSNTDNVIADYILENRNRIMHESITELAKETFTSPGAVTRFCKRLGMKGYRDFKVQFVSDLEKYTQESKKINVDNPFNKTDTDMEIMHNIAQLTKNTVDQCYASVSGRNLEIIAGLIRRAERIYFYANGDSQISVIGFINRLLKAGKIGFIADEYNETNKYVELMNDKDLVIAVSYSGNALPNKHIMGRIKNKGVKTVVITSKPDCWMFDYHIIIPKRETYEYKTKVTTFYSQIAIQYIFNCLYTFLIKNI